MADGGNNEREYLKNKDQNEYNSFDDKDNKEIDITVN
jgi:hypothetical protein